MKVQRPLILNSNNKTTPPFNKQQYIRSRPTAEDFPRSKNKPKSLRLLRRPYAAIVLLLRARGLASYLITQFLLPIFFLLFFSPCEGVCRKTLRRSTLVPYYLFARDCTFSALRLQLRYFTYV